MRFFAWVASWILFWMGHVVSKGINTDYTAWLYPIYNKLMILSGDIQDKYEIENGPWEKCTEADW